MAIIKPFEGILYNPLKVNGDMVMAPPYDVITQAYKDALYNRSACNVVRIDFGVELPEDNNSVNKYTRAKDDLELWMSNGILVQDEIPYFYAYEIDYTVFGKPLTLRGLMALVKIEELGNGVYPHEATYSKPKADRLNLLRTCLANTSPIYALYNSRDKVTSGVLKSISDEPWITSKDSDGAVHRIYKIHDLGSYEEIIKEFKDKAIYIADGHHRYEVALEFQKEMQEAAEGKDNNIRLFPYDYVLMFLANIEDDGISVLPTHRLIKGIPDSSYIINKLRNYFDINTAGFDKDIREILSSENRNAIGMYVNKDEKWYILKYTGGRLKDLHPALSNLDVVLLHELIFKRALDISDFAYEMNASEALRMVQAGDFDAAFFLNPTKLKDVEQAALANKRMPPKSTYFYPKLLTGMVINSFNKKP